ncbi:MAG: hypothetical protein HQL74_02580 [Magnetococcales bacterium]|nr:hypothetical protein [Magnetococcales bacterium]
MMPGITIANPGIFISLLRSSQLKIPARATLLTQTDCQIGGKNISTVEQYVTKYWVDCYAQNGKAEKTPLGKSIPSTGEKFAAIVTARKPTPPSALNLRPSLQPLPLFPGSPPRPNHTARFKHTTLRFYVCPSGKQGILHN